MLSDLFTPIVWQWFEQRYSSASPVQQQAWPTIHASQSALIAAPTGSGKTLAAFLAVIDKLVKQGMTTGLPDATLVVYVSPLKALSNDIHKNLQEPLEGISRALLEQVEYGAQDFTIRAQTRTGDTSQAERTAMKRNPPHILVTTPESLYLLLTSVSGRKMLQTTHTVIVDEIHALAGNKRGAHLMLSLARLEHLSSQSEPLTRIGLSATQKPIETMAHYLMGHQKLSCEIIDIGHVRQRDLQVEVTSSPLEAIMANEVWTELYDRLEQLILNHRTTLIFVNTRRLAERASAALADRLGEQAVTAHHGSLAKEHRLDAEQRLKQGSLKALVATASLELGIDIGDVDLVCQMGSPRGISILLQRVGRSGHQLNAIPKGRLFPLSRDDLLECCAMLSAIKQNQLDQISIPDQPLDVLAQQIVAELACQEWDEQALYKIFKTAWPYRDLSQEKFTDTVKMLADGFHTQRGRRSAYLHRDAVHGKLRPRKSARLTALLNGGAIPDQFDYDVVMQPEGLFVGTLNEDFAFESLPGDIFQLGNSSYRMLKIEQGRVYVEDAHSQPPNIPFWFGEAPGRSDELSQAVSALSIQLDKLLEQDEKTALDYLQKELDINSSAAEQLIQYLAQGKAALTVIPSMQKIVFERFFDETGDMHLVIHSPYGSRLNRAWGLALRKRFCRHFNFELQAAAGENNIVLSLGPTHSFPLLEPVDYLKAASVKDVLIQALLDAPMFPTRWRWVCNTALAVPRNRSGKKVPAIFQRNNAEDLAAVIFPDQLACLENITAEREVPDHPLVEQTMKDCLHELMDINGLQILLTNIESGTVEIIARDLTSPSPFAQEILNARPYAFLDDAPAEERRTLAIQQRRFANPEEAGEISKLNPEAILKVTQEAWPIARNEDELHDALLVLGFISEQEAAKGWQQYFSGLQKQQRATLVTSAQSQKLWVAAERLEEIGIIFSDFDMEPAIQAVASNIENEQTALNNIIQSRMEGLGPITANNVALPLGLSESSIETTLMHLQQQGSIVQGHFSPDQQDMEWCERGLLARIHRYTLKQLRSEIEPVSPADFMRFLFHWQGLDVPREGEAALKNVIQQLEGFNLPAVAWEQAILPRRLKPYFTSELDQLCSTGEIIWLRLNNSTKNQEKTRNPVGKSTNISLLPRAHLPYWRNFSPPPIQNELTLTSSAQKVIETLKTWGASFFQELLTETGLLKSQLQTALGELIAHGLITADSFQGLRHIILPQVVQQRRRKRSRTQDPLASAGRWSLLRPAPKADENHQAAIEHIAHILLKRYGVVFRAVLFREENIPSWRELLYVYRRMEARGELRGGRFIQGFAGEHYALPEAVSTLRKIRKQPAQGELLNISAADPLNLCGIISPGEKVSALAKNRILFRDGIPLAINEHNKVTFLQSIEPDQEWQFKNNLLKV